MNTAQCLRPYTMDRDWDRAHAALPQFPPAHLAGLTENIRPAQVNKLVDAAEDAELESGSVDGAARGAVQGPRREIGVGGFSKGSVAERIAILLRNAGPDAGLTCDVVGERSGVSQPTVSATLNTLCERRFAKRAKITRAFAYSWTGQAGAG